MRCYRLQPQAQSHVSVTVDDICSTFSLCWYQIAPRLLYDFVYMLLSQSIQSYHLSPCEFTAEEIWT